MTYLGGEAGVTVVHLDDGVRRLAERELAGRDGAWFVLHTRIPDGDATRVTHLETLAASVAASRSIGYFPAGPLYWGSEPSEVSEDVDHSRLRLGVETPERRVRADMTFTRHGKDVRTMTLFRHETRALGRYDLLLTDAEALIVDVAGLSAGFARVTDYTGEVRYRLEAVVPDGGTMRLRACDETEGHLRAHDDCPTTFEPLEGGIPVPDGGLWPGVLYGAGLGLARRFGVREPQLIPRPDVLPSFAEVLAHGVEKSHR